MQHEAHFLSPRHIQTIANTHFMLVVPDLVLIVFKIILHLTFRITVNFSYYHLYFTDGKTEIQKDEAACPQAHSW